MEKILLIDDNPVDRFLALTVLEGDGYQVAEAANGIQGLDALDQHEFSLLIVDLIMPQMGGLEFLNQLKTRSDIQYVPKLVMSGGIKTKDIKFAVERGSQDHIKKTIDIDVFQRKVKMLLGTNIDSRKEIDFRSLQTDMYIKAPCQLLSLCETKGTLMSSFSMSEGDRNCIDLFVNLINKKLLLEQVDIRITSVNKQQNFYLINFQFIDLTELLQKQIREAHDIADIVNRQDERENVVRKNNELLK